MPMTPYRTITIALGTLLGIISTHAQVFQFPITVTDDKGSRTVLTFGYGRGYTYCIDADTSKFHPAEIGLPPPPPSGVFDARITDTRGGTGACLDQGVALNIHDWYYIELDTFKIQWQLSSGATIQHFSWPAGLNTYFNRLQMKDAFGGVLINWDMFTETSDSVTNPAITQLFIYVDMKVDDWPPGVGVPPMSPLMPDAFSLGQNYPNPFNPATTIRFSLPGESLVRLAVYDILGTELKILVDCRMNPGYHEARFDAAGLPSGVYYYRITTEGFGESRKMLLLR